jgi:hypothetical protein
MIVNIIPLIYIKNLGKNIFGILKMESRQSAGIA